MERNGRARVLSGLLCAAAATSTILTGCARTWTVPEGLEQQFRRDALACERDAAQQSPAPRPASASRVGFVHPTADYTMAPQGLRGGAQLGTTSGDRAQRARLVDTCMAAKGYQPGAASAGIRRDQMLTAQ
jgi:hypothetical protein